MAGKYGVTEYEAEELSQLVAGNVHLQKQVTIASGNLKRGTVLAMNSDGDYVQFNPFATDGTEVPRAILAEDVDATGGPARVQAYFVGKYRLKDLIWPDGITDAQKQSAILGLQDKGIIVE